MKKSGTKGENYSYAYHGSTPCCKDCFCVMSVTYKNRVPDKMKCTNRDCPSFGIEFLYPVMVVEVAK